MIKITDDDFMENEAGKEDIEQETDKEEKQEITPLEFMGDLKEIIAQTAISVQSLAESVGSIRSAVGKHETAIRSNAEAISNLRSDFEAEKEYQRETEYVSPSEANAFGVSIKSRVFDLLKSVNLESEKFIWGCMMRKCWSDCKKHSNMVGTGGIYTQHRRYKEVLNYIGGWEPEGYGGLTGYINHLNLKKGT